MLSAAVDIVKKEGPSTLLSGLGPTVVGYGIEGAMKVCKHIVSFCEPSEMFPDLWMPQMDSLVCMKLPNLFSWRY